MTLLDTHRRSLLAVALLVTLAGSVLAAWSLVELSRAPVARAEAILHRIRSQTLGHYWSSEASLRWYLIQDRDGRAIGYSVRTRHPWKEGFAGLTVQRLGEEHHGESWSLDATVTQGAYVATLGGRRLPDTQIVLRDGQVTVTRPRPGGSERAAQPVPGNYIPEGLLDLVIAEVAKAPTDARFCLVVNSESIITNELHFTPVTMSPQGGGKVRVRTQFLEGVSDDVHYVDAKGEVFRIDNRNTAGTTRLIDLHSLARQFPEVLDIQRDLEGGLGEPTEEFNADDRDVPPSQDFLEAAL